MRIRRIEIDGDAGHLAIERLGGTTTIRIDSILREPKGEQAWVTWEVESATSDAELFGIAQSAQHRCDGVRGTNSMIHEYYRELQRFQD